MCASEIRELRDIYAAMACAYDSASDKRTSIRPVKPETQLGLWICLGTGCRIGELLQSRWEHVDLAKASWFVPRENTRTNVDWQVYLSEFALRQFKDLHALTGDSGGVHQATPRSRLDLGIRRCLGWPPNSPAQGIVGVCGPIG